MKDIRQISIFLASPGDVVEERNIVREVVEDLNPIASSTYGCVLRVYGWDSDTMPEYGEEPQAIVNKQVPDMHSHDLFVGIMWNRFGTPTSKAGSGTEEEFNTAVDAWSKHGKPFIQFYFNEAPATLGLEGLEQRKRVLGFKDRLQTQALLGSYNGAQKFRGIFRKHMEQWLASQFTPSPNSPSLPVSTGENKGFLDQQDSHDYWALLDGHFLGLESLVEPEERTVQLVIATNNSEEEAMLRSLRADSHSFSKKVVNFAYGTEGGLAEVESVELSIKSGKSTWTVRLRKIDTSDYMDNTSYNGKSPDTIATMRAKLILLNEPIPGEDSMLSSFVRGFKNDFTVPDGLLPDLWEKLKQDEKHFKTFAPLWATMYLKATNTCEQVLQLDFGNVANQKVHVRFKGRRKKIYSNESATEIIIDGYCDL